MALGCGVTENIQSKQEQSWPLSSGRRRDDLLLPGAASRILSGPARIRSLASVGRPSRAARGPLRAVARSACQRPTGGRRPLGQLIVGRAFDGPPGDASRASNRYQCDKEIQLLTLAPTCCARSSCNGPCLIDCSLWRISEPRGPALGAKIAGRSRAWGRVYK